MLKANNQAAMHKKIKQCATCNKDFQAITHAKYCSKACKKVAQHTHPTSPCAKCGSPRTRHRGGNLYCAVCAKSNYHRKNNARQRHLKNNYNLSEQEFLALFNQNPTCKICKIPLSIPSGKRSNLVNNPAFVDHNHQTGEIRGLLCHACNTGLGFFKDCPKNMQQAIYYLNRSSTNEDFNEDCGT